MEMNQFFHEEGNALGGWGVSDTGDIERIAPGLIERACTTCAFRDFDFPDAQQQHLASLAPDGASLTLLGDVSMRVDPYQLWYAMDGWQSQTTGNPWVFDADNPGSRGKDENVITEDITSAYIQASMDGQIGDKPMQIVLGVRYEKTDVYSATRQAVPQYLLWESDNGVRTVYGEGESVVAENHDYDNLLPSLDFYVDLTDEWKLRASFSQTISRPEYTYMFVPTSVSDGSTLTYLGGIPSGSKGTAKLDALESDNFDLSVEYYYGESNYASIGFFSKKVSNFVGIETVKQTLFGLRDVTQRAPGNRLDRALAGLAAFDNGAGFPASEESLFTMTAILDNPQDFPNGADDFDGTGEQALMVLSVYDIIPDGLDPVYVFSTAQPVNNQTAGIDGFEIAVQHFFGDSGFGIIANATLVNGDIEFDNGAPPTFDQFALEGLSDSANLIGVWENDRFGARLAYNWRDSFLDSTNVGDYVPRYYDEHAQLDVNFSWLINDRMVLSLDGINVTEEGITTRGRTQNMKFFAQELDARWTLAFRWTYN
jgi:TonB-dependent receptor